MPATETAGHVQGAATSYDTRRVVRFGVFDIAQDVRGLIEITASDTDEPRLLVTWWRGERTLCHVARTFPAPLDDAETLAVGPLSLTPSDSGAEWQVSYETADLSAQLRWRAAAAPCLWRLAAPVALEHEEQFGTVVGTITVRGETLAIDALGHREYEHGPSLYDLADQVVSSRTLLSPDDFAYTAVVTVARRDYLFGQLISGGSIAELSTAEIVIAHAFSGGPPLLGMIDIEDRIGRTLSQSFERGAMFTIVEAARARLVSRHIVFPELRCAGRPAIGQIDQWHKDDVPARPHIFASTGAERRP
jgi:hypothetical protein